MKTKRKRGRRAKLLTPEIQESIFQSIAACVPEKFAALLAGVSERTFYLWKSKGREDVENKKDTEYAAFLTGFQKASADGVAKRVERITQAAIGGAVVERTTVTKIDRNGAETTTVTEKVTRPEWTADAWVLERVHDEQFASYKRELAEIRKEQSEIRKLMQARSGAAEPLPTPE